MTVLCRLSSEAEGHSLDVFVLLRSLRDYLLQYAPAGISLDELSMGISGDYEISIEEGATIVRVGQAIFGAHALIDPFYWPNQGNAKEHLG